MDTLIQALRTIAVILIPGLFVEVFRHALSGQISFSNELTTTFIGAVVIGGIMSGLVLNLVALAIGATFGWFEKFPTFSKSTNWLTATGSNELNASFDQAAEFLVPQKLATEEKMAVLNERLHLEAQPLYAELEKSVAYRDILFRCALGDLVLIYFAFVNDTGAGISGYKYMIILILLVFLTSSWIALRHVDRKRKYAFIALSMKHNKHTGN